MKHLFTLLTSAALWLAPTAQAQQARETIPQGQAYTVIANPGEDASHSIRIGWHTDEGSGKSFCFYASPGDKTWHKAEAAQELCTAYDSLYSKTADNKSFFIRISFFKFHFSALPETEGQKIPYCKYRAEDTLCPAFVTNPTTG